MFFSILRDLQSEDKTDNVLMLHIKICEPFLYLNRLFEKTGWQIEKPVLRQHKRRRLKRKETKTNFASYEKL